MRFLHVTAEIIEESRRQRKEDDGAYDKYNLSLHCPVVIAARQQVAPGHYGAYSFLGKYATEHGKHLGWKFIRDFDCEGEAPAQGKLAQPVEIELVE